MDFSNCAGAKRRLFQTLSAVWVSAAAIGVAQQGAADAPVAAAPVGQAVIEIRGGGALSGEVAPYKSGQIDGQLITISDGLRIGVSDAILNRIREDDAKIAQYRQRLNGLAEDAKAHWEMSQWCNSQGLHAQKERHLRRVIELDPNHGPARQALDYMPLGNTWVKRDSFRRSKGMVREKGKWRFAEELAGGADAVSFDEQRIEWIRKLRSLKSLAARNNAKGAEALAEIQAINDPAADEVVRKEFLEAKGDRQRAMWLTILARLKTPLSIQTLAETGLNDRSQTIRDLCFEALREHGKYIAIQYYLSRLFDNNNEVVQNAGRALTELSDPVMAKDPQVAMALVDALETTHTEIIAPGPGMQVGMASGSNGSSGPIQQFGGDKPQARKYQKKNQNVLNALLEVVEDDVDYQFNKDRWRVYFASKFSPPTGDLRRDP